MIFTSKVIQSIMPNRNYKECDYRHNVHDGMFQCQTTFVFLVVFFILLIIRSISNILPLTCGERL